MILEMVESESLCKVFPPFIPLKDAIITLTKKPFDITSYMSEWNMVTKITTTSKIGLHFMVQVKTRELYHCVNYVLMCKYLGSGRLVGRAVMSLGIYIYSIYNSYIL